MTPARATPQAARLACVLLLALAGALACALPLGCAAEEPAEPGPPIPPPVETHFKGNDAVGDGTLNEVIARDLVDFEARGRRKSAVDDAAYSIELHYVGLGFPFVKVTAGYEPRPDGTSSVTFEIEEGPRTVIEEIRLAGNDHFSDSDLAELFRGPTAGAFGTGQLYFVKANLEAGVAAIASLYWGKGFLHVEVSEPEVAFSADRKTARVRVRIDEGLAYRLARIDILGPPDAPQEDLRAELAGFVGQPYFPQVAYAARARLLEFYGVAGHPDAVVTFTEDRDDRSGDVALTFTVEPGPLVTVAGVRVHGVSRTEEDFILERLKLEPGETWSRELERKSFSELYKSGLFSKVSITLEPSPDDARMVDVEVTERPSREFYVEPGYGSYEGARLTLGYRDRNIFGTGRIFHVQGSVSNKAQRALAGITDPWFWDGELTADVSVFYNHRIEPSFTRNELGVSGTLTRQHSARWQTAYNWTYKRSRISDVDVEAAEPQDVEDVDISSISITPAYESRDDPFAPHRGAWMRTTGEWGSPIFGSELDFLRGRFGEAHFLPLGRLGTLALAVRTGIIVPIGSTDSIPLQERFFTGGENTVRSFKEDELGPKDDEVTPTNPNPSGDPLGGEAYTVLNVELRRAIGGRLEGALFVDAGNVIEGYAKYFRMGPFSYGIGAGLRYMLPVGPIRLDFAVNPAPHEDEDNWVAHLTVGMPF